MPPPAPEPTAIVCASPELGVVLVELVRDAGLEVVGVVARGVDAAVEAARMSPDVVVFDLAAAGTLGAESIAFVRRLAPETAVVAIVPFPELTARVAALGALAVLTEDDLRLLPGLLRDQVAAGFGSIRTKPPDGS